MSPQRGCITCRIRKIKCDRNKPSCDKCLKTGRRCDGYGQQERCKFPSQPLLPIPSLNGVEEARALQFFRIRAATSLSGPYDGYFWTDLVLQVSNSEPIIRHAILAISSMYEDFSCKARESSQLQTNRFALFHYNAAVRKLRDVQHEPLVLLACLLFICIEVIQDNKAQAITHCRHGLAILHSIQPTAVWAHNHLAPIFQRLTAFPVIFGGYDSVLESELPPLRPAPKVMMSMNEANSVAEELLKRTVQLICCGDEYRYGRLFGHKVSSDLISASTQLIQTTEDFKQSLKALGRKILGDQMASSMATKLWYSCCELRAEYCWIWGSLALDLNETSYDRFLSRLGNMTHLIRFLSGTTQQREARHGPKFQFDISYLAIAHVVVMKCRDLTTRLEALDLVKTYGAIRESFWEADKMYQVGRRVIEVEHGLVLDEFDQPIGEVSWTDLPPEERRVRNSFLDQDVDIQTRLDGKFITGKPLGLIMRDRQENIYLQYEFVSVELADTYSKPILVKMNETIIRPHFRQGCSSQSKCILK